MLTHASTKYRGPGWPPPCGRARRRMVALGALGSGMALSIACGGNADSSAAGQGSISQTCARYTECVVEAEGQPDCEERLANTRTTATEAGCTAVFDAFLSCEEQHPGVCEVDRRYTLTPECDRAADAVEDCIRDRGGPPQECSFSTGACPNPPCPTTCDIDCNDFAAQCSGWPGEPMMCVCTEGGRAGQQFSVVDCGVMNEVAPATCR